MHIIIWTFLNVLLSRMSGSLLVVSLTILSVYQTEAGIAPFINEEEVEVYEDPDLSVYLENGRLPGDLLPEHYVVQLQPDIFRAGPPFPFYGQVNISFLVLNTTDRIVLNSVNLNIDSQSVQVTENGMNLPIKHIELDPDLDFLYIHLDEAELEAGSSYNVYIEFDGILRSPVQGNGLYYDQYRQDGQVRYLVATQMQRHSVRFAFPVFDEPAMKATFDITLLRHRHYRTLSNAELSFTEEIDVDWVADHFETTPKMSSYLLAIVVTDFEYTETFTNHNFLIRNWARQDMFHALETANLVSRDIIQYMENFTEKTYQINKLDQVALPSKSGAMENWGLVLYSEAYLLYDHKWHMVNNLMDVTRVIAHELAHMWFGNLVTCEWWDYTWLNEGFASYFEYMALEALDWDAASLLQVRRMMPMMVTDTSNTTVPVQPVIDTPWTGGNAFSSSSYSKGASMVRMLSHVLGHDTFRKGLVNYLDNNAYSSAVTSDLWDALTEQAALDNVTDTDGSPLIVGEKFNSWVLQSGIPLLEVTRNYDGSASATVTQKQFNPRNLVWPPSEYQYMWNIPLTIVNEEEPNYHTGADVWLEREPSAVITTNIPYDGRQWVLVNVGARCYYRVLYDKLNYDNLVRQLTVNHTVIHHESRAALIDDTFTLARAGITLSEVDAFEMTKYLGEELEYGPWARADFHMSYPGRMLMRFQDSADLYKTYIHNLTEPVYMSLGWQDPEGQRINERFLRQLAIRQACKYGNTDCAIVAGDLFNLYLQNTTENPISVDQRAAVYCTALRDGSAEDWNAVYEMLLADSPSNLPNTTIERRALRAALSCSNNITLLQRYLDMMFDPQLIPASHVSSAMGELARSQYGRQVVWNHIMENWRNNPTPTGVTKSSMLNAVIEDFATEDDENMFLEFLSLYPPEDDTEANMYATAQKTVAANREWAETNQQALRDWLLAVLN